MSEEGKRRIERALPDSLRKKQQDAIEAARRYREEHGDPLEQLHHMLTETITDHGLWQEMIDAPYR
jgi:hypothetical protein